MTFCNELLDFAYNSADQSFFPYVVPINVIKELEPTS